MNLNMQLLVTQYYTFARSAGGGSQAVAASRTYAVKWTWAHNEVREHCKQIELELFAATLSA